MWRRLVEWWREVQEPFDYGFPDPDEFGDFVDRTPEGLECPDTQPTSPGALDTLHGRLE